MKPGLRKVAALILATATMFGGGALSASTAFADDLTVDSSTQVQADTSNSGNADTNSGDTQSDTTSSSNADSQTQSDVHSDTSIRAQSAPEDAKDVTIHDMLDTDSAYVSKLKLTDRVTGTAPFDNDNERGDDKDASNDIVRSFDDVIYDYDYTVTPDSTMDYYKRTRVGFRFELPYPADKVTFDTDQMGWVDQTPSYQPKLTTETINGVKTQVYTCYRLLEPTSNSPTVNPGTSAISLAVAVKGAPHGYKFHPTVKAWAAWDASNPTNTGTHKQAENTPQDVTVSAKLNLNVSLQYQITGGGTYDFNTGDATAPNKGKGKIQGRQLHVLVRTAMRWKDKSKGLKGIEVPTGSIGYKLNVSSVFQDDDDKHAKHSGEKQWQPILWDRIHHPAANNSGVNTHNRKNDSFDHNGSFPSSSTVGKDSVNDGTTVYDDGTTTDKGTTVNVGFTGYDTLNYPCANATQYSAYGKCTTAYMDGSLTQQQVAALHVDEFTFILPTATTDGKTAAQYYGKDQTGMYTYTVDEQDGTLGGITYDTTSHTVTITVTEDAKSHKLAASVAYSNGKTSEKSILFQNTYQPEDVLVELSAKKNLTGRELQAYEFEFELVDDKGNVIDSEKNDKQGNIQFRPLTYGRDNDGVDDCGEYRYVIREKNTGEKNVTYDKMEHHVTVTVSDNLQGNLTARVEYDPTDDSAKDSSTMLVTPTDKADKTDGDAGEDENNPTTTPSMVTTNGTQPEFTNSYIPPVTPAIVKAVRQLAQTGVNTPIMAVILFALVGMGLMLAHRRGNTTVTARHKK